MVSPERFDYYLPQDWFVGELMRAWWTGGEGEVLKLVQSGSALWGAEPFPTEGSEEGDWGQQ